MRAIISLKEILFEMIKTVDMVNPQMRCPFGSNKEFLAFQTVIPEDNFAAFSLPVNQKVTNTTKHWLMKFHFSGIR